MAIEFRCTHCSKLLRTGDETAGRQAKCPDCGTVMTVPAAAATTGAPPPPASGDNPFVASPQPSGLGAVHPPVLDLGDIFSRTWTIFKERWSECVAAWLVVVVLSVVICYGCTFAVGIGGRIVLGPRGMMLSQLGNLVGQLVAIWLGIGLAIYFLKVARGQPAELGDVFTGGPRYLEILLASLLFGVIVGVGTLFCVVPGVILALMFSQFYYLVLDGRLPVTDAFSKSKELTAGNKATLFLIWLVAMGLAIAAAIPCGLGLIFLGPYLSLLHAMVYLTLTGQPTAEQVRVGPA